MGEGNVFSAPAEADQQAGPRWPVLLATAPWVVLTVAAAGLLSGLILERDHPLGGKLLIESVQVAAVMGVALAPPYVGWVGWVTRWRPTWASMPEASAVVLGGMVLGGAAGATLGAGALAPTFWGMRAGAVTALLVAAAVALSGRWTTA